MKKKVAKTTEKPKAKKEKAEAAPIKAVEKTTYFDEAVEGTRKRTIGVLVRQSAELPAWMHGMSIHIDGGIPVNRRKLAKLLQKVINDIQPSARRAG